MTRWVFCDSAQRERGNWRVAVAGRLRNHGRIRVKRESAFDARFPASELSQGTSRHPYRPQEPQDNSRRSVFAAWRLWKYTPHASRLPRPR